MYVIQNCFICRPSDSTESEDAGIETSTVETLELTAKCSNHSARSHPPLGYISSTTRPIHSARSHEEKSQRIDLPPPFVRKSP
jgi:hypothetical protein